MDRNHIDWGMLNNLHGFGTSFIMANLNYYASKYMYIFSAKAIDQERAPFHPGMGGLC